MANIRIDVPILTPAAALLCQNSSQFRIPSLIKRQLIKIDFEERALSYNVLSLKSSPFLIQGNRHISSYSCL